MSQSFCDKKINTLFGHLTQQSGHSSARLTGLLLLHRTLRYREPLVGLVVRLIACQALDS
jgi:hypothetical protein